MVRVYVLIHTQENADKKYTLDVVLSVVNLMMTLILEKFYIYAHFTDLNIVC